MEVAARTYVYVSSHGAGNISVFALDPGSGKLDLVQTCDCDGKVMPMAIAPDRCTLYAALRSEPYRFVRFSIDPQEGTLTFLDYSPAADSTVNLCTDTSGRFLLGACNPPKSQRRTGIITVYPLDETGAVLPCNGKVRTPPKLHSILPDPTNRFAFAASCDGDVILRYRFDTQTGTVSSDGLTPVMVLPKAGPRHMRFHPNGRFFYLISEYDASVYVFAYNSADGSLSELQIVSALPDVKASHNPEAADIHLTPDGRWLYASVRDPSILMAFAVNAESGLLSPVGHFPTPAVPRGFGIEPEGRYLVAAGETANRLVVYTIDQSTGALAEVAAADVSEGPNWIEFLQTQ